jgi:hypothetical protein
VLRRCDFWVDQKYDLINARIKRIPQKQMEEKLRMLGRLMGCSRQLDVTMYNKQMVQHYVSLFMKGDYSMGYGDETDMEMKSNEYARIQAAISKVLPAA